ncbi:MAG: 2,3-bisphosphoglycerate-dependent phosphoglycerate mutase [Pseudomonadota bacterium]|nr:2,3-bisphosphoglycerate-dependent phosphoglycerate mutase [Pseudomonadota bacterium]
MPSKSTQLVLIRHGESEYNALNQFTGAVDCALTNKGLAQARTCANWLRENTFHSVFCSKQQRALQTRDILLQTLSLENLPQITTADLNERDYGDLNGMNKQQASSTFGISQVQSWRRDFKACPPGGETLAATAKRAYSCYKQNILPLLLSQHSVLVVAHGNSIRGLIYSLMGLSEQEITQVEVGWCEPWIINFSLDQPESVEIFLHRDIGKQSRLPQSALDIPVKMHGVVASPAH